jgi:hypothetical protein
MHNKSVYDASDGGLPPLPLRITERGLARRTVALTIRDANGDWVGTLRVRKGTGHGDSIVQAANEHRRLMGALQHDAVQILHRIDGAPLIGKPHTEDCPGCEWRDRFGFLPKGDPLTVVEATDGD